MNTCQSLSILIVAIAVAHHFFLYQRYFEPVEDIEVIYVRHGESTMNAPMNAFDKLRKDLCASMAEDIPNEICKILQSHAHAKWISENIAENVSKESLKELQSAAVSLLKAREQFDATLTAVGLKKARDTNNRIRLLQIRWQEEHDLGGKTVLVSSNLIRAVDTLLNSFSYLVNFSIPLHLHSALQEFTPKSGNADVVSVFLPAVIRGRSGVSTSQDAWRKVAQLRFQQYSDAGMLDMPWAPTSNHDMSWWRQQHFSLTNAKDARTDRLVNHCYFMPNSHVNGESFYREPPSPEVVETVNLGSEYTHAGAEFTTRFHEFQSWLPKLRHQVKGLKRVIIVGHSRWFQDFVQYLGKHAGLHDPSCQRLLEKGKLRNNAMLALKTPDLKTISNCSCLMGTDLGAGCFA